MNLPLFPMNVETLHEDQLDCFCVEGPIIRDFGPWRVGDSVCLTFDLIKGIVTQYSDDGEVLIQRTLMPLSCE